MNTRNKASRHIKSGKLVFCEECHDLTNGRFEFVRKLGQVGPRTTLLNILANFIPDHERILVIEDTADIQIGASNIVRFEARVAQNGFPAVTIRELLMASLRHCPDRILLGEIRGPEAFDLLQLLNHGRLGDALYGSRQLSSTSNQPLHQLRSAEQRRASLSSHQEQYR